MSDETGPDPTSTTACIGKGCEKSVGNDPRSRADAEASGWFFRRNGDAWCGDCIPGWVETWRAQRANAEEAAYGSQNGPGRSLSTQTDTDLLAGLVLDDAELRGAVAVLRHAATLAHNGAPSYSGMRGRVHLQSLYNEGASPWLDGLADALAIRTQTKSAS